jgi:NADPH:quinone reductase-like Zn-dependent oxidoreductase
LTFGDGIMKATNGRGVDMVLNSITGPGFKETSLKSCSKNARFVEMSKLNIWSEQEVKEMRPDVKYSIVDLGQVEGMEDMSFLFSQLEKHLYDLKNPLKALPYTRFDVTDVRSGLNYLEKAKQIGKVVCVYPEPPTKEAMNALSIKLFNDRSTYLITGGCGGIGFEVCKWMCENGARTVVIVGRKLPSAENLKI